MSVKNNVEILLGETARQSVSPSLLTGFGPRGIAESSTLHQAKAIKFFGSLVFLQRILRVSPRVVTVRFCHVPDRPSCFWFHDYKLLMYELPAPSIPPISTTAFIMTASSFPSISSLLNSPPTSSQKLSSQAKTYSDLYQRSPSPAIFPMSMDIADYPATQRISYRELLEPGSSTLSSPRSVSTIIGPESPRTAKSDLPPLVDLGIDDPCTHRYQPPNAFFDGNLSETFSQTGASIFASQPPLPVNPDHLFSSTTAQSDYINSLLKICTTSALKAYQSLLPPPAIWVMVQQQHPRSHDLCGNQQFWTTTEYYPHSSPQAAYLCAEALDVARVANAKLSLTQILDLISHARRGEDAACHPQQLERQGNPPAKMADLFHLAARMSSMLSRSAEGFRLNPPSLSSVSQAAQEFCNRLGDVEATQEIDGLRESWRPMCSCW